MDSFSFLWKCICTTLTCPTFLSLLLLVCPTFQHQIWLINRDMQSHFRYLLVYPGNNTMYWFSDRRSMCNVTWEKFNYTTVPVYNEMFLLENQYLKVLLEKLFLGLLALFFLGVGVRLLRCSKSGITTFTKLIKQGCQWEVAWKTQIVPQPNATITNTHKKKKCNNKEHRWNHISAYVISSLLSLI